MHISIHAHAVQGFSLKQVRSSMVRAMVCHMVFYVLLMPFLCPYGLLKVSLAFLYGIFLWVSVVSYVSYDFSFESRHRISILDLCRFMWLQGQRAAI